MIRVVEGRLPEAAADAKDLPAALTTPYVPMIRAVYRIPLRDPLNRITKLRMR
jgi:hypothetical protein